MPSPGLLTTGSGVQITAGEIKGRPLGRPIYYNDVYINEPERFKKFVDNMGRLCVEDRKS